jgi:hypothetical protein
MLTGYKNEDIIILIEEMKYIDKLANQNNLDKAMICAEKTIKVLDDLGLENKYKYFYDIFKTISKNLSYMKGNK